MKPYWFYPCIGCQRVDQTDVGTFRRLDRAHTSVVGVVYISHLRSGTVPGQTARAQGRRDGAYGSALPAGYSGP